MFYSHFVYVRDGPLAKIWLAAHVLKQLNKADISSLDIANGAAVLMGRGSSGHGKAGVPFALRVSGQLLLGLVRIYEKKVIQTVEDAEHLHTKVKQAALPDRRRKSAAANGKIELEPSELRARDAQITLHDRIEHDDEAYANLGGGFDDPLDPLAFGLDDGGMVGEEWMGDMSILGAPHGEFDAQSGIFTLTGPAAARLSEGRRNESAAHEDAFDGDVDKELVPDEEGVIPIEDDLRMDEFTRIEDGRATDLSARPGFDQTSINESALAKKVLSELDEFGGGSSFEANAFGDLLPADDKPPSVAASVINLDEVERELDEAHRELERTMERRREQAKKKRKATAFQPQVDDLTEISGTELRRWLADTSDIVAPRAEQRLQRSAKENFEHLSQASSQQEEAGEPAVAAAAAASSVSRHLFDLPATGLGHAAYGELSTLTRLAQQAADAGRFAPRLLNLLQSRLTTAAQLPGLAYAEVAEATADDKDEVASIASARPVDGSLVGDGSLGQIGMDGHFGFGEDPFTQAAVEPAQEPQVDGDLEREAELEAEQPLELEEQLLAGEEVAEGELGHSALLEEEQPFDGEDRAAREARAVRAWWNEKGVVGEREGGAVRESVESGWSVRTKKMHAKLKGHFVRGVGSSLDTKPLSFHALIADQVKPVAAGSFYQLLVLASGGYLKVRQEEAFGDILLAKTPAFEKKLPKLTDDSSTATATPDD